MLNIRNLLMSERDKTKMFRENLRTAAAEKTLTGENIRNYLLNKVLPDHFGIDTTEICRNGADAHYKNDLGLDSIDMTGLEIHIEDDFKINSYKMLGEEKRILNNKTVNETVDTLRSVFKLK